jgi:L-methionine (R)-S-oxide reductase
MKEIQNQIHVPEENFCIVKFKNTGPETFHGTINNNSPPHEPVKSKIMINNKAARYDRIHQQIRKLFLTQEDLYARMATLNALLYHKMDGFFWVGFYLLKNGRLLVGPYQGPLACLELPKNKGVCWEGIIHGKPVVVPDVHAFPGHIACDPRSKSEIVIPIRDRDHIISGVLDIDSNLINNFDETDAEQLGKIVGLLTI